MAKKRSIKNDSHTSSNPPPAKKSKTECSIKKRYSSDVKFIDTQHPVIGVVENQFEGSITGNGKDIAEYGIYSENIGGHLLGLIQQHYDKYGSKNVFLLGSIAWFSDAAIINKMKQSGGCIMILNDENFKSKTKRRAFGELQSLPRIPTFFSEIFKLSPNLIMSTYDNSEDLLLPNGELGKYGPILTLGTRPLNENSESDDEKPTNSSFQNGNILHTKYLIICVWFGQDHDFIPITVWTGSFNFTAKANRNHENAIMLSSLRIAKFYYEDFVNSFQAALPPRC